MFEFFSPEFITASVKGVPLLFVVIGIVTVMRKAGLTGRALLFSSLGWGTAIGTMYQLATFGMPEDLGGWFAVLIYGLAIGILAALFYDTLKGLLDRSLNKLLEKIEADFLKNLSDQIVAGDLFVFNEEISPKDGDHAQGAG